MKVDRTTQPHEPASGSVKASEQDPRLKSIQKQMENVQEEMKRLSENKNISLKEKEKMMKELRMEFQDLKWQFSNRQKEIVKEKMEKQKNMNKTESNHSKATEPLPENNLEMNPLKAVHNLIGVEASLAEIKAVNAIKKDMQNQSDIIKSEIRLNKRYSMPIERKLEAVYKLNEKIKKMDDMSNKSYSNIQESNEKSKKMVTKTTQKSELDIEQKEDSDTGNPEQKETSKVKEKGAQWKKSENDNGQSVLDMQI
ncbi:FlxA-like family protein [Fusibacter ferrireducens]|uniref:FlxA-like family protein n=1 Tax=Fusibacter ferrireducens TaxID=2785058 RepID=A0ABR9ZN34_9FIRM|nr:FlxA-like family protein [Fusibacter ferrireducens]MBF4691882.1 FlxA-like family protein [Fusibacter ferrireducens]